MFRLLSVLLGAFSALLPFNLAGRTSGIILWAPKLIAGALAPWIALAGLLLTALGLRRRDPILAGGGLLAVGLASSYTAGVLSQPAGFTAAFGPDWQSRIPDDMGSRMLQRRWTPLVLEPHARVTRDVVYAARGEAQGPLCADIWQPLPGTNPSGLAVIYVHGGAWRLGDKDMGTRPLFRRLAGQGHTVMDIEYTLAPAGDMVGMIGEVKRAIVWMKRHGAEYDVNPQRIVLMGGSAGAHLALMAAYTPNDPAFQPQGSDDDTSVRGVVGFYGPADLAAVYADVNDVRDRLHRRKRIWPYGALVELLLQAVGLSPRGVAIEEAGNFMAELIGVDMDADPDRYHSLSPVGQVGPHCPPTLLLQGAMDIFGLAPATRHLYAELQAAGVASVLVEFPKTDHAFDLVLPHVSPAAQASTYEVERFLALLM